jgi:hypothetical protein
VRRLRRPFVVFLRVGEAGQHDSDQFGDRLTELLFGFRRCFISRTAFASTCAIWTADCGTGQPSSRHKKRGWGSRLDASPDRRAYIQNQTAQPAMRWIGVEARVPEQ